MSSGLSAIDFQSIFEATPGSYLILFPDAPTYTIVAVNDAYLKATMTQKENIVGRGLFEIFPDNPNDPATKGVDSLRASLDRVIKNKIKDAMAVQKYDVRKPPEQGGGFEEKYWSPINTPVFDLKGQLAYIIHRVEDITEFMKMKQEKGKQQVLNEELQVEIFNSSQKLTEINKNLRTSNEQLINRDKEISELYEKLYELDMLKTQFFANVSHELRTPLTLILAPIERLVESPNLSKKEMANLKLVERNSKTLLKHVNDLLDVSKLDAGKLKVSYEDIDLTKLIRFICSHFEGIAEEKPIEFVVNTPKDLHVQVDSSMIQKVFTNLLSNAFKFTPETGKIKVDLISKNGEFCIQVEDTGPGVPKEYHEAIFERFRQVEGGSNRRFGGTGLGLAIAKEFVMLHKGTIKVENSKTGGSVFTVKIPKKAPAGVVISEFKNSFKSTSIVLDMHANGKTINKTDPNVFSIRKSKNKDLVLVVDDNQDMNHFLSDLLREKYQVASAFDGLDGLSKAIALKPDLIISDLMMPLMSGDSLVLELRKNPDLWTTPIIMLTAKNEEHLKIELLKSGVEDYMLKPFHPDELMARVRNLLATKKTREILQTALKSKEIDIKVLSKELVKRGDEIRRKNFDLLESNGMLRQALKARDEFLSVASHELKTPLTSLQLQLQLLDKNIKPEVGQVPSPEFIKDASLLSLRQINSLTQLVEGLLDISQFRLGKMDFSFKKVNISELIKNVISNCSLQLKNANCTPELELNPTIEGELDRMRMEQVITNLISNIIKYAPGKPFKISLRKSDDEKAIIQVIDHGIGIAKEKQALIFDQFERAGMSKNISGLGLGLFIAKRIVENHQGKIFVESEVGTGTVFTIELPLQISTVSKEGIIYEV